MEKADAIVEPSGEDNNSLSSLLHQLKAASLTPDELEATKAALMQAVQSDDGIQALVSAWLSSGSARLEESNDGLSVLNDAVRAAIPKDADKIIPVLSEAFTQPELRQRATHLLLAVLRSSSRIPANDLQSLLDHLTLSILIDTSPSAVHASSEALFTAWPIFIADVRESSASLADMEQGYVGRMLAAVGRAMTWGWMAPAHDPETTVVETEDEESETIPRDRELSIRPEMRFERLGGNGQSDAAPDLSGLLTMLYGLYPANTLAWFRAPLPYIREHAIACPFNAGWTSVLDETLVRDRAHTVLTRYIVNPSILTHSAADEMSDRKRFQGLDKDALLVHCLSLRTSYTGSEPLPPPSSVSPETGSSLDSIQPEESKLVRQLRTDLEVQKWIAASASRAAATAQRMAEIHRSGESERQSLYLRLRELRSQLQHEQEERQKQRAQADVVKEHSKVWVDSLQEKLKRLREEKKSWAVEAVELRSQVSEARRSLAAQGKLLAEESAKAFKLAAQRLEESPKFERVANYERRIDQLMAAQKLWADDIRKLNELQEFVALKENEFQRLGQVLRGRIEEIDMLGRAVRKYEAEIVELKARLAAAERAAKSKALSPMALEYAANVRAEMTELQKELEQLREQNEQLLVQNDEQVEMLEDMRLRLASTRASPSGGAGLLRLPSTRSVAGTSSRSRRGSEDGPGHAMHLSLQLSPAAAVPPVLSTPMLGGIVGSAFPTLDGDTYPQ